MSSRTQIKIIGSNGQISLGKEFAGKTVRVDTVGEGCWMIRAGQFIPDSEKWLHEPEFKKKLDAALEWADKHEPRDNFEEIIRKLEGGKDKD